MPSWSKAPVLRCRRVDSLGGGDGVDWRDEIVELSYMQDSGFILVNPLVAL